ncbi:MAG: hypothetical protein QOC64_1247, partial [Solirubrobacteraceae bacterium]|nr:hypothetical protein [Solirubrobacteraceae bacterium]
MRLGQTHQPMDNRVDREASASGSRTDGVD